MGVGAAAARCGGRPFRGTGRPASARQLSGRLPRQAAGASQQHSASAVLRRRAVECRAIKPFRWRLLASWRKSAAFTEICAGFAGLTGPKAWALSGGGAFSVLPPEFFCEKWSAHETAEKSDRSRCRHHSQRGRSARHTRAVRGGRRSTDPTADSGAKGTSAGAAPPSAPGSSALGPWRSFLKPTPAQSAKNRPHQILVVLGSATQVTGKSLGKRRNLQFTPLTSDAAVEQCAFSGPTRFPCR